MPIVYLVREGQHTDAKTKKHYAVYKEVVQQNREMMGQLILRGWTTPVPPFPERLIVHLSTADADSGDWRNATPSMNEPIKHLLEEEVTK